MPDDIIRALTNNNYNIKTSSGSSKVYIDKKDNIVIQQYISYQVAKRISDIMLKLLEKKQITLNIVFQKGFGPNKKVFLKTEIKYDPFNYITPFLFYIEKDNIIAWKKITPLNESEKTISREFLKKNFFKIWYDISKGLNALKTINIIHNDTVIDNIGIYNGNFVLFDFDASDSPENKGKDFSDDFKMLKQSFKFRDVYIGRMEEITGIMSLIQIYSDLYNISLPEAFEKLENLEIEW